MRYRGYHGRLGYDEYAQVFYGEVIGVKEAIFFNGNSLHELEVAFKQTVDRYLDACAKLGKAPEKKFSGRLVLRISSEMHERIVLEAKSRGVSLNTWIKQSLKQLLATSPTKPVHD